MIKRVIKTISVIAVICLTCGIFSACGSGSDNTSVKLVNSGTLTVCTDISYPPFEFFAEDGITPLGADIDLINEVADRLGLEVEFIDHPFEGIFDGLGKNYDVVCSAVTITEDRQQNMLFSMPYIDNYQCVIVPSNGGMEILSFADLDGTSVAVKKGTTAQDLVESLNSSGSVSVKYIACEQSENCFDMLEAGQVNAVICDSTIAAGMIKASGGIFTEAYRDEESPEEFAIAISRDNTELKGALDEVLTQMELDGITKKITELWFGDQIS